MDIADGPGFIDMLFGVTGGSRAAEFGGLVQLRVLATAFGAGYLDTLAGQQTLLANATLSEVAPIPLPGAALAFMSGAGLIAGARRRQRGWASTAS